MMAPLRWISGLVLAASLVSCAPQPVADETTAAATTPDPASATAAAPAEDIASQFVSDLIANATQADEEQSQEKRSLFCTQDSLTVNLGYAKYRGYNNASTGLNYWKGSVPLFSSCLTSLPTLHTTSLGVSLSPFPGPTTPLPSHHHLPYTPTVRHSSV
jgi:hypothetical protein